ncbi:hypothetical protein [Hymenobacter siberiensis]|uniref:hypothetical protein n=1 Tax=Hymenobacter siberiensis TaxID=2848396 RepID=UPI001C1E68AB|nr:hypothetical protein [Hymenobacter siberiensis]
MRAYFVQILLQAVQYLLLQAGSGRGSVVVEQAQAHIGKLAHEGQRVLQLIGNARRKLAHEGPFLGRHQLRLNGAHFGQRLVQGIPLGFNLGVALVQQAVGAAMAAVGPAQQAPP